ncbi:hypothetical protein HGRIS_009584 [Hohenbuehelia grisea]|uniref:FAD/NAD(P)-binding domain-containing protein n=1 Tax=Hohenbuehelia grisea TaxID=104357 RepID=A0ABR3J1M1_9AGAR
MDRNSVTLSKSFPEHGIVDGKLHFEYAVYALGSTLPAPLNLWGTKTCDSARPAADDEQTEYHGTKPEAVSWLKCNQKVVEDAQSVLVVGGGALGIQFATDIADIYPSKKVTLLHSRTRVLPKYTQPMHDEVVKSMKGLNIEVILGERLDLDSTREDPPKRDEAGRRIVRTLAGRELAADLLLLCTGQSPNTQILSELDPKTLEPDSGLAHVLPTMQLGVIKAKANGAAIANATDLGLSDVISTLKVEDSESATVEKGQSTISDSKHREETPYPNIFVIGDSANAFGAIQAGHTAFYQGEVAGRNVLRLVRQQEDPAASEPLEDYKPTPPGIKISLGRKHSVHESGGKVGTADDGVDDLHAAYMWPFFGMKVEKDEDMYP